VPYTRLMGRGQSTTKRFDAVLGARRGVAREYDDLLAGREEARPQVEGMVEGIGKGDLQPAFTVLGICSQETGEMNAYVQELTDALSSFAAEKQWDLWAATAGHEGTILRTAKGEMPFDATARRVWGLEMEELMECALLDAAQRSAELSQQVFDGHAATSARKALVLAFASQCSRGGMRQLTRLGGGQRAMKELVGSWPPQKKIEEVFGYEDWQEVVSAWLPKAPHTARKLKRDREDDIQREADKQELADIVRDELSKVRERGHAGATW